MSEHLAANPEVAKVAASTLGAMTGAAAKAAAQKGVEQVAKVAQKMDEKIGEDFEISGREIRILCSENLQRYSMALRPKKVGLLHTKTRVEIGAVKRCQMSSLRGLEQTKAINILERGFEIDLRKLVAGEDYLLETEYEIKDSDYLENLVSREDPRETPSAQSISYWMYAQLKFPEFLRGRFGAINLRDLPFLVDVAVHKDLNTHIPKTLLERLETIKNLARPIDTNKKFQEWDNLRNTHFGVKGKSDLDVTKEVYQIFTPERFKNFVDVTGGRYSIFSTTPGSSMFDFSYFSWPRTMTVVSRADLTLDLPVAEGNLVFKRRDMLDKVDAIFK